MILKEMSAAELVKIIHKKYLELCDFQRKSPQAFKEYIEQLFPLELLREGWGMYRSAYSSFGPMIYAMKEFPVNVSVNPEYPGHVHWILDILIGDNAYSYYCLCKDLKSGRHLRYRVDNPEELLKVEFRYDRCKLSVKCNTILGYLPTGYVRRLLGWGYLKIKDEHSVWYSRETVPSSQIPAYEGVLNKHNRAWAALENRRAVENSVDTRFDELIDLLNGPEFDVLNTSYAQKLVEEIDDDLSTLERDALSKAQDSENRERRAQLLKYRRKIVQLLKERGYVFVDGNEVVVAHEFFPTVW